MLIYSSIDSILQPEHQDHPHIPFPKQAVSAIVMISVTAILHDLKLGPKQAGKIDGKHGKYKVQVLVVAAYAHSSKLRKSTKTVIAGR